MVINIFKTIEELDDDLCSYCHRTEYGKYAQYGTPNGYVSCEGQFCDEAYESYLEENDATEKMIRYQNSVKLINKGGFIDG